jgi:4-hydroxybutyrate CoA-transferase
MPVRCGATEAIRDHVRAGDSVLLGTGAGVASTLQAALVADAGRLAGLRLSGGLQIGDYAFMAPVRDGTWSFDTWHVMPPIRADVQSGLVGFHLIRGGMVPRRIRASAPDVFLATVSPPDARGRVSLGASVSYAMRAAHSARVVLGEINPDMPVTRGDSLVSMDRFATLVDSDAPLPTYRTRGLDERDFQIARFIRDLLPDPATVQIGIGGVPEALVGLLREDRPDDLRLFGMGIDAMVPLLQELDRPGAYAGGELLGTTELYRFSHDNPLVEQYPSERILSVPELARHPHFVSVNAALQVDLTGQVNSEWAGRQISGPGGAVDFVDAALLSEGGVSFIGIRSTGPDGSSNVVSALPAGTPVTIPRHSVQIVVTEYGVADLRGLPVRARAQALASVAHPAHRGSLLAAGPARLAEPA